MVCGLRRLRSSFDTAVGKLADEQRCLDIGENGERRNSRAVRTDLWTRKVDESAKENKKWKLMAIPLKIREREQEEVLQ